MDCWRCRVGDVGSAWNVKIGGDYYSDGLRSLFHALDLSMSAEARQRRVQRCFSLQKWKKVHIGGNLLILPPDQLETRLGPCLPRSSRYTVDEPWR